MKNNKLKIVIGTLLCLLPIVLGLYMWNELPAELPAHWNINGEIDGYVSKAFGVFGLPLLMAAFNLLCHFGASLEKRKENYSKKLYELVYWIVPVITLILYPIMIFTATGKEIKVETIVPAFVCVILIIVGNYLPKCKQNSTMGIKIPWTLKSEENWNRTHRFGGWIWMISGIIGLVLILCGIQQALLAVIAVMLVVPIVYSYILHKKGI